MTRWLTAMVERILDWTGRLPSTNARISVSLLLAVATGVKVVIVWTAPPAAWLLFLAGMMGIDYAQYRTKRLTHKPAGPNGPPDADGTAG